TPYYPEGCTSEVRLAWARPEYSQTTPDPLPDASCSITSGPNSRAILIMVFASRISPASMRLNTRPPGGSVYVRLLATRSRRPIVQHEVGRGSTNGHGCSVGGK